MHFPNHADMKAVEALIRPNPMQALTAFHGHQQYLTRRRLTSLLVNLGVRESQEMREWMDQNPNPATYPERFADTIVSAARDRYLVNRDRNTVCPISPRTVWILDLLRTYPSLEAIQAATGESRNTMNSALKRDRELMTAPNNYTLMAIMYEGEFF